jgi:hypothetical protein
MTLQARMSEGDQRLYNPNRDVAHNFSTVVGEVADRLEEERWPAITAYLKDQDVTEEQLGAACKAFIEYVAGACDSPDEKMTEVLTRVGWYKVPEPAQVAYMAYLGTVMSGVYFVGAREATLGGEGPCDNLEDLRKAGRECHKAMTVPKWRRPVYRLFRRLGKAWNALFGANPK